MKAPLFHAPQRILMDFGVMKQSMRAFVLLLAICLVADCSPLVPTDYTMEEGDILFQSLPSSPLVKAIESVTQSPYSHCGMVAKSKGHWVVIEAIGPVREVPLSNWIAHGRGKWFAAYRLNDSFKPDIPKIISCARNYLGRPYDIHYRFDDERIYCSELIFKAVRDATGKKLGRIDKLGELNWRPNEAFIRAIEGSVPFDREMITPVSLSHAPELKMIYNKRP